MVCLCVAFVLFCVLWLVFHVGAHDTVSDDCHVVGFSHVAHCCYLLLRFCVLLNVLFGGSQSCRLVFFELSRSMVFVLLLEMKCLMLCSLQLCVMTRACLESDMLYGRLHCRICCRWRMFLNSSCHWVLADNYAGPTLVWFIVGCFVICFWCAVIVCHSDAWVLVMLYESSRR